MHIIGFNFDKILAERKKPLVSDLKIHTNIDVKDITEQKVEVFKDKEVLKFDFMFTIDYQKEIANLDFGGFILLAVDDKKQSKDILQRWKKKDIPAEIKLFLFNFILAKCSMKALQLEEDLGLPTHVQLPRLTMEADPKSYVR
ncbi:MAG: hypothetical protein AABX65_04040 [Nanoarchaeota archaeon]